MILLFRALLTAENAEITALNFSVFSEERLVNCSNTQTGKED
jgi:hypothetical protein